MFVVTLSALVQLIYTNAGTGNYLLASIAAALFILAVILAVLAYRSLNSSTARLKSDITV